MGCLEYGNDIIKGVIEYEVGIYVHCMIRLRKVHSYIIHVDLLDEPVSKTSLVDAPTLKVARTGSVSIAMILVSQLVLNNFEVT